jgi:hypothetical protein
MLVAMIVLGRVECRPVQPSSDRSDVDERFGLRQSPFGSCVCGAFEESLFDFDPRR